MLKPGAGPDLFRQGARDPIVVRQWRSELLNSDSFVDRIRHAVSWILMALSLLMLPGVAAAQAETAFRRIPTQFIAALGAPGAKSGTGAETWGLWTLDPGPRGVRLADYASLQAAGVAPAKWAFDNKDWWLEEHGLIMEPPDSALRPGKYMVTGDREIMSVLTVSPKAADGTQTWELADGATIYDVTHLRCRAARYKPETQASSCTPATVQQSGFPVPPDVAMPAVAGCQKQDYAVLFVIGMVD
jgi:hypothetical protein